MFKFYFVVTISVFSFLYFYCRFLILENHPEKYTDAQRYDLVKYACSTVQRRSKVNDEVFGLENLPSQGGYIMYSNHQGRYDCIGIIMAHEEPCSVVIDKTRSKVILLNQITQLVRGQRLDKKDMRNQIQVIQNVATEVSQGKKYIIFPEGGYPEGVSDNSVREFMPGSFKAALKAKCPIVPITIVDSYKVFSQKGLKSVTTQIHFLEPIPYEEYKNMRTQEISDLVKSKIIDKLTEVQAI